MKLEGKQASPKSGNETLKRDIVKENSKGIPLLDSKVKEDYVDQFLYQTNDEAVDSKHDHNNANLEPLPIEGRSIVREEHEMPELVKDICVDEGVPVHDKFLFDTSTMDDYLSTFLPPGKVIKGGQDQLDKEPVVDVIPDLGVLKIPEDKGSSEDVEKIHFMQIMEVESEAANSASNVLKRSQSLGDLLALPEPATDSSCLEPLSSEAPPIPDDNPDISASSTSHTELENDSKPPSSSLDSVASTSKEPSNARNQSEETERHSLDSVSDDLTNEVSGRLSFENRAINAADTKLLPPPPNHDPNLAKPQLITSSIVSEPTSSSLLQHDLGDASFSAVPVPFSGSISMRSDSSTTSARSFAFPVLQSEWNSSPVRMAKADRRRLRKQRYWKNGILCCKF
ncbi:hypothetical protein LINPERHAP1_LOCUS35540 [Linum perenne]